MTLRLGLWTRWIFGASAQEQGEASVRPLHARGQELEDPQMAATQGKAVENLTCGFSDVTCS